MAKITKNCLDLVKEFEGCYLKAYRDEVGVWTIGYGVTNSDKVITKTTIKAGVIGQSLSFCFGAKFLSFRVQEA